VGDRLVRHREDSVAVCTRAINRLHSHLHDLDPSWDPTWQSLTSNVNIDSVSGRLDKSEGMVARVA
jgi:hypothetical protein